ncbi:D-alanine--D-alanine ligase [Patescibacteria group bacterium]
MDNQKINVGILFGGKSAEHEVSLQSAKNVFEAIDKNKYNPVLIGIDKTGTWKLANSGNFLTNTDNPELIKISELSDPIALLPQSCGKISKNNQNISIDVVFPILHGPFGEDGTVQGLLKLANIPFVGAGVLGSAVGMDKDIMKRLLRDANIPIGKFITLKTEDDIPKYDDIKNKLDMPCFVKPANLGSSVGVNKASNETELKDAIKEAFEFDNKIIIEEFIDGKEIECAILGNSEPQASVPGEIILNDEFYSYETKYIDSDGAKILIPAKLPPEIIKNIQEMAIKTFKTLECEGLARVDFFLKDNREIIVNEINTIPGFTKISMYPKLWEASGISYSELIDKLIQLAIERFDKEKILKTSYE